MYIFGNNRSYRQLFNRSILFLGLSMLLIMGKCNNSDVAGDPGDIAITDSIKIDSAQEQSREKALSGIDFFEGTWEEALAKAKEENKVLFVDAYADWCRPCKEMERDVFTQQKVGDFYNEHFINFRLDIEEGEGEKFSEDHDVMEIPTFIYFNGDGKIVHRTIGKKNVDTFIADAKKAVGDES